MSGVLWFLRMTLVSTRRRIVGLIAFGAVFVATAATARVLTGGEHGHVELDPIFALGGTTLISAVLLLGWLIGRFPLIAALVLMAGVFSHDRAAGYTRLYAARPRSLVLLYSARFALLMALAFVLSIIIMPVFDLIMLGEWAGMGMIVLIAAQIIVFGTLTALLSTIMRADAWAALFLAIVALLWHALRRAEYLTNTAPFIRDTLSVVLPPQGALLRIESAFGAAQPVPLDAFLYVCIYGALVLVFAGVSLVRREI
jgi:hypothetical protein